MAVQTKFVDLTKSYIPGDPNTFPQNLHYTEQEDAPDKAAAIFPYEGYNFLPTAYGYRGYFGTSSKFGLDSLPSNCQAILLYQLSTFEHRFIALCEKGIYIAFPDGTDLRWIQHIPFCLAADQTDPPTLPEYDPAVYKAWTWCIIEDVLYMYRQGDSLVYKTAIGTFDVPLIPAVAEIAAIPAGTYLLDAGPPAVYNTEIAAIPGSAEVVASTITSTLVISSFTPTFLNMAGQMGIFKAGLRLGFWDSANSVSWSSNLTLSDFTPSVETLAGNTIFGGVVGRIITVKQHGDAFIVYATKSIVGTTFTENGSLLWDAKTVSSSAGALHSGSVTIGRSDTEHIVFSTGGLLTIGKYDIVTNTFVVENILPEIYDQLKESRDPIYLSLIQQRYLCFSLINIDYIDGVQSFEYETVNPYLLTLSGSTPASMFYAPGYHQDGFYIEGIDTTKTVITSREILEIVKGEILGKPVSGNPYKKYSPEDPNLPGYPSAVYSYPWYPGDPATPGTSWYTGFPGIPGDPGETSTYDSTNPLSRKRSRFDDRKWVPLYTTTLGRMDSRYYADWEEFQDYGGVSARAANFAGRTPFRTESSRLHDIPAALTSEVLAAYVDAYPLASSKYGSDLTFTGIRAFPFFYGGDTYQNNESLIYDQEDEWECFRLHQTANIDYLQSISDVTEEGSDILIAEPEVTLTVLGTVLTGDGNIEWLINEGPSEFAKKEIIMRKYFNKSYRITKRVVVTTVLA